MKVKTGLVLSGGGARGIAHAGVLQALDDLSIKPDRISGTSSGAIIGAMYAGGVAPKQMLEILKKSKIFEFKGLSFDFKGLLKADVFRNLLKKHLHASTFEDLSIPLSVCVTDFTNAKSVIFEKGPIVECVAASCTIPMIFSPVVIDHKTMVDGGLLNNFPVEPLLGKCEKIIGVHVNPLGVYKPGAGFTGILERCFHLSVANTIKHKADYCNLFIEPEELSKFGVFDTKAAHAIFDIGYRAAMEKKDELLMLK